MDGYFAVSIALAYVVMALVYLLALVLYMFSFRTKLRVHAPLVDGPGEGEVENSSVEKIGGTPLTSASSKQRSDRH